MEPSSKIFTVAQAEEHVRRLTPVMAEIGTLAAEVRERSDKIQVLDVLWGDKVGQAGNPDHAEYRGHEGAARRAVARIEALVRDEIVSRGIRFPKGGLEHGLLDFPTTLDGRVVFLCWRLGESGIGFWHEVDGGFAGRRPVTAELAARMGVEDAG